MNLVLTRVSQINGCAVFVDMHTKDAEHAEETSVRLNLVAAWRDAKVFTDAERAALELAEQGTRIADAAGGVTDEVWANAAKHYDADQLAALVCTIATINAYNRLNVIGQNQGGDYQPGQWDDGRRRQAAPGGAPGITAVCTRSGCAASWLPGELAGGCRRTWGRAGRVAAAGPAGAR